MENAKSKLLEFYKNTRRMPSYSEMMKLFGYKSKSAVNYAVEKLVEEGVITKDKSGKIVPADLLEVKMLGVVEAGFPSAAEEDVLDTLSLDDFLIENNEATYLLKVKGESMIDAGIVEGDIVVVERGANPKPGDIVIAEVDGEYTMKYYRKTGSKVFLEAANKKYPPIYPDYDLKIEAVVRAVIRKY